MRFVVSDLKRGLTERSFFLSVIIGIISVMIPFIYLINNGKTSSGAELFIMSQSMIMPFIAPILATMSYSTMSMIEKESRFDILMLTRSNMKSFELKRFITNGIISGLSIVIPLIMLFISANLLSSFGLRTQEIAAVIIIDFLFGFAYGSLAYSLTFLNSKKYIPIVAPQVIYMLLIYAFPYLGLTQFYPPLCFSPWIMPGYADIGNIVFALTSITFVSLIIVFISKYAKKYEVDTIWR